MRGCGLRAPAHADDTRVSNQPSSPHSATAGSRSQSQFEQIASVTPRSRNSREHTGHLVVGLEHAHRASLLQVGQDRVVLARVHVGLVEHRHQPLPLPCQVVIAGA